MNVRTLNISPSNPVNLTMSVSPEWVNSAGGRNAIHIMRVAYNGTTEILETKTAGYDQFGNFLFIAGSLHVFSTFGLLSAIKISTVLSDSYTSPVPATSVEPSPASFASPMASTQVEVTPSVIWLIVPTMCILLFGGYLYLFFQLKDEG